MIGIFKVWGGYLNYFFKLICVSSIYALFYVIEAELMLNIYRISRFINLEVGTVSILIGLLILILIISSTFIFYMLNKKFIKQNKWNYLGPFICLPIIFLFISSFTNIFPMYNEGDRPIPIIGLVFTASLILYPFYLLTVVRISTYDSVTKRS